MNTDKKKKVVFSEEVDSSINGFALGISFVLLALFVIWFKVFSNTIAESITAIFFLLFGIVGTMSEIEKIRKDDIKGIGDAMVGLFLTTPTLFGIIKTNIIWLRVILLAFLLVGMYGLMRGIFEIIYSLKLVKRENKNKKIEIMQIIVTITQVIALVVVVLQLIFEIKK